MSIRNRTLTENREVHTSLSQEIHYFYDESGALLMYTVSPIIIGVAK